MKLTHPLIGLICLLLLSLALIPGCKDSVIPNQPLEYPEAVMTARPQAPIPSKSPETPVEIMTYRFEQGKAKVVPLLPLILGICIALGLVYQLLRVIYDLTTSSPGT